MKGNRRKVGIELKFSSSENYNLGTHENVKVKIKCDSPYGVPEYKTTGSVGMDVRFYERGED